MAFGGWTAVVFGRLIRGLVPVGRPHGPLVITALLIGTGFCASSNAATLGEELAILLATHPRVAAAQHSLTAAEDRVDLAFSRFLPTVQITGDAGYEETDSPARRSAQAESFRAGRATSSISLTENLFDGFRSTSDLRSAKFDKRSIEHRLREERQNRVFEGTSAYLGVIRQTELIEVARENEQTIMIQLDLEDERVRRGSGIEVDILLAKSRLQLAKEQRVAFEGQLQDAISRYIQVFGHAPDISTMEIPELPFELQPTTLENALAVARSENPTIAASDRQIEVARQRRQSAKANFYPRLDFVVRGNWEDDANGIEGPRRDAAALLQFNWELFSGFATNAEVAQANSQLSAITSNHAFVDRAVAEQVRLAWEGLNTAARRRDLLENAVLIAGEVFRTRGRLRDSGKETAINVLDAEREVNNSRINLIAAEYSVRLAFYRLLLAMGRLTADNLGVAASSQ